MSRNNYKKNTYALIKRGEIYEITKEGNVKKAKNRDNVPFYTKYKISQVLYKESIKIFTCEKGRFYSDGKERRSRKVFLLLNASNLCKRVKMDFICR